MMNFRLFDAIVEALQQERKNAIEDLVRSKNADLGEFRFRIGLIYGIDHCLAVAEETRKRLLQE